MWALVLKTFLTITSAAKRKKKTKKNKHFLEQLSYTMILVGRVQLDFKKKFTSKSDMLDINVKRSFFRGLM